MRKKSEEKNKEAANRNLRGDIKERILRKRNKRKRYGGERERERVRR